MTYVAQTNEDGNAANEYYETLALIMIKVKRALISVSDKRGIVSFARQLHEQKIEILSTGGTSRQLREAGIPVKDVSSHTGFPEMLDGRVKTLHPKIHGGLLSLRDNPDHMKQVEKHDIGLIDMVVVNLYPFAKTIQKKKVILKEAIENIDIGGPSMLRSAAKNFKSVAVISNPDRYKDVLKDLKQNQGMMSESVLFQLAVEAFTHTAEYDTMISTFLKSRLEDSPFDAMPADVNLKFTKDQDLRYGENPHQKAAFYKDENQKNIGFSKFKQLHGKELSFNNLLDLNAAIDFVKDFKDPAAVVIKHNNPTGVAVDQELSKAYVQAHACDPLSAFGGIIALNKEVDEKTAKAILKSGFMECIIAPKFSRSAVAVLTVKKNLRLLEMNFSKLPKDGYDYKKVYGGLLLQEKDSKVLTDSEIKVVTKKKPTKVQMQALKFGWQVIKNVKSNAIVLVKGQKTVGIGGGMTSRVDSVKLSVEKAGKRAQGSVLISDAFFPKTDNIEFAAKAGVKAIIQPGGSIADQDVIAAADQAGIAMVFTGCRHFKH